MDFVGTFCFFKCDDNVPCGQSLHLEEHRLWDAGTMTRAPGT